MLHFEKKNMLDTTISSLNFSENFYNDIELLYSFDPFSGRFNKAVNMYDKGSVDYYRGYRVKKTVENRAVFTDDNAIVFCRQRLSFFGSEVMVISFMYQDLITAFEAEPFTSCVVSYSPVPMISGETWTEQAGTILSVEKTESFYKVECYVHYNEFTRDIKTVNFSSVSFGQVSILGVKNKTLIVKEDSGAPAEGVEVTIHGISQTTDEFGQVTFSLAPGQYTVFLKGPGFANVQYTIQV